jgi:hypothetical protein
METYKLNDWTRALTVMGVEYTREDLRATNRTIIRSVNKETGVLTQKTFETSTGDIKGVVIK